MRRPSEDELWSKMRRNVGGRAEPFTDGDQDVADDELEDDAEEDDDPEGEHYEEGYLDGREFVDDGRLDDAEKEDVIIAAEAHRSLDDADEVFERHHGRPASGREPGAAKAVKATPANVRPAMPPATAPGETSRAWLSTVRMTRTEVGLRLALYLLREGLVRSDITIALTGVEMTGRKKRPVFPVAEFLAEHGCVKRHEESENWRDRYALTGGEPGDARGTLHGIVLCEKPDEAPMFAELRPDVRLLVDVMGGPLDPTRSNREHVQLRTAIGRAMTLVEARRNDIVAVAMPRSRRFRVLARSWRDAPRIREARLRLAVVDRAGNVEGLGQLVKKGG